MSISQSCVSLFQKVRPDWPGRDTQGWGQICPTPPFTGFLVIWNMPVLISSTQNSQYKSHIYFLIFCRAFQTSKNYENSCLFPHQGAGLLHIRRDGPLTDVLMSGRTIWVVPHGGAVRLPSDWVGVEEEALAQPEPLVTVVPVEPGEEGDKVSIDTLSQDTWEYIDSQLLWCTLWGPVVCCMPKSFSAALEKWSYVKICFFFSYFSSPL